jgi:predicted lipoprotein with Yx(FWY)xxD motif
VKKYLISWRQLAAVSTVALLAACGSTQTPQTQPQAQVSAAPSGSEFMQTPTSAGTVLTTANGMTLYTSDKDIAGQSTCYGDCAQYWHPYLSNGTSTPSGKMTLVTRTDGTQQWAYNGRPLYTFVQDTASGEVKGNDFHNNWHVVTVSA